MLSILLVIVFNSMIDDLISKVLSLQVYNTNTLNVLVLLVPNQFELIAWKFLHYNCQDVLCTRLAAKTETDHYKVGKTGKVLES